jgi:hypothetical protein
MRTLLLSVLLGLLLPARGADPTPKDEPLLVRFYTVWSYNMCCPPPNDPEPFSFQLEEPKEEHQRPQGPRDPKPPVTSVRDFFAAKGVLFPPGAIAISLPGFSLLAVKNTAENFKLLERIIEIEGTGEYLPKQIVVEARFVEFRAEQEGRLAFRGSFAEWHKALVGGVRTLAATSLLTKSANRTVGETGRPLSGDRKESVPPRPGTEGADLELEPTISPDGWTVDLNYDFRYSAPPGGPHPAPPARAFGNLQIPSGKIVVARTFTAPGEKKGAALRHFAVLLRAEIIDSSGRPIPPPPP